MAIVYYPAALLYTRLLSLLHEEDIDQYRAPLSTRTTIYIIKRNYNQLVWQLDAASERKYKISNLDIKQPSWISGMMLTHYFPDEFRTDYESNFLSSKGFTHAHLRGQIEKHRELK